MALCSDGAYHPTDGQPVRILCHHDGIVRGPPYWRTENDQAGQGTLATNHEGAEPQDSHPLRVLPPTTPCWNPTLNLTDHNKRRWRAEYGESVRHGTHRVNSQFN